MVKAMVNVTMEEAKGRNVGIRVYGLFQTREIFAWWSSICGHAGKLKEEENQKTCGSGFLWQGKKMMMMLMR
jgi:hypothetical protein